MAAIERRQRAGRRGAVRWRVRWRAADGRERSKTFETHGDARRFRLLDELEAEFADDDDVDII